MTLQFVHELNSASKASSLYCRWVSMPSGEGERLAGIWIDPEMRAFETESARETSRIGRAEGDREVTIDLPLNVQKNEMAEFRIEEAQQQ